MKLNKSLITLILIGRNLIKLLNQLTTKLIKITILIRP